MKVEEIISPNGYEIAYESFAGNYPAVMFFTGFKSNMSGQKAEAVAKYCSEKKLAFTRFDYGGHGKSGGEFDEGTIGSWLVDALSVFDKCANEKTILVGSSMGAWIAFLLALKRPKQISGIIGISSAPDFTERLILGAMNDAHKKEMQEKGFIMVPNCYDSEPYKITKNLIEEGRNHLLLGAPIDVKCPVRLLHGGNDEDVPVSIAHELVSRLPDAKLTFIEDGNHRLSRDGDLELISNALDSLVEQIQPLS